MSTEPLSPREAGRRYLHRGTLGDVSSNGHRRPKFVVTEVRWCIPHANPHEYERPRYQQGRTSGSGSGSEPLSSRDAGRRYLHPTSASAAAPTASFSWTQAAATLHQRGAWERCGHGCERGDGGGTTRSIAHVDDLATWRQGDEKKGSGRH